MNYLSLLCTRLLQMAFREAHEIAGKVVTRAEQLKCDLTQIPISELHNIR
jgi:argininosuccinate lyase